MKRPVLFPVLLEEIRAARENMGKYTRKTSLDYEDSTIVKTRDYRDALIRLMQEVTNPVSYDDAVMQTLVMKVRF